MRPRSVLMGAVAALAFSAAPALAGSPAHCAANAKAGFARVQLFKGDDCTGPSVIVPKTGDANQPNFAAFRNYDASIRNVDNSRSSLAIDTGTCVRLFDGVNYGGLASTDICAPGGVVFWNLDRFDDRATSMRVCSVSAPAQCAAAAALPPPNPPTPVPVPAPAPASSNQSAKILNWALGHVSWWAGLYSMRHRLPNLPVRTMQTRQPPRGLGTPGNVKQGCDCSSFVRWVVAQAGIDAGSTTSSLWTGRDKLGPLKPTNRSVNLSTGHAARGWGNLPPGGYHPGDLIFYGVTDMTRGTGHVALYLGNGNIVQCSGTRGSNAGSTVTSEGRPLGWVRYDRISG